MSNQQEAQDAIQILAEKPPIYDDVCEAFKLSEARAYFTYGNKIYNPHDLEVPKSILVHEAVHIFQQKGNDKDAALWWGKFLRDPDFRIEQEAYAYGAQYNYIKSTSGDREWVQKNLMAMAKSLSGPLYGSTIGLIAAMNMIKKYATKEFQNKLRNDETG